jgi:peptidoglycan-associated lipoprotein
LFLAACSSTPVTQPAAPAQPAAQTATAPAAPRSPSSTSTPVAAAAPSRLMHLDPNSAVSRQRSVYFDFDDATVRPDAAPVIELQGQYLSHNPALKVVVQGNTDERGGSEYNLALGQRRAQAVKAALQIYGVKETQVEAVSFGKEKPVAPGHDEAAWRQNRRGDIVYPR